MSRWWGRRHAGVVLAVALALLVVHHPLMGLMSAMGSMSAASTAAPSMAAAMAPSDTILMDASAMDGYGGGCVSCPETCPMHALAPDRSARRIASSQTWTLIPWGGDAVPDARLSGACAASARVMRAAHYAPSAHTWRAILQVFLL